MRFSHQSESRRCMLYGKGGEANTAQHVKSIKGLGTFQDLLFYTSLWQKDQRQRKWVAENSSQIAPKTSFKRQSSPQMTALQDRDFLPNWQIQKLAIRESAQGGHVKSMQSQRPLRNLVLNIFTESFLYENHYEGSRCGRYHQAFEGKRCMGDVETSN